MSEQVILAVGDICGPPGKNPGAEATAALARLLLHVRAGAMTV